jgi:hypothetical protein
MELEKELNGSTNTVPKEVIKIIKKNSKTILKIDNKIPMTADLNHIGWEKIKIAKENMIKELIKKN